MIIQIIASANGNKDYFNKTRSGVSKNDAVAEATRMHITLKNMLSAQNQNPVFEFQDDDLGYMLINVQSYNFITFRIIEEHEL